ncbi:hypothetical protein HQ533_03860 [Candidatus Woesearchaeota archaeon]|nr:hypothetical protein [Candidatus Woesearchaeota archaeon]
MKMHIPDFLGSFYVDLETMMYDWKGAFGGFIIERRKLTDEIDFITGRTADRYGDASFEGEISALHIEFTKKYSEEAIAKGASKTPIFYRGEYDPSKNMYLGQWTHKLDTPFEEVMDGDKVDFYLVMLDKERMKKQTIEI